MRRIIFGLCLTIAIVYGGAFAQDLPIPLFLLSHELSVTSDGIERTRIEMNVVPDSMRFTAPELAYAPDGTHAVIAMSRRVALPNDEFGRGTPETTLTVWTAATNTANIISPSPNADIAAYRRFVTWSPDGDQFAYVEFQVNVQTEARTTTLWIYSLEEASTTRIADVTVAHLQVEDMVWREDGLLLVSNPSGGGEFNARSILLLDPATGDTLYEHAMPFVFPDGANGSELVYYNGTQPLILHDLAYPNRQHTVYDPFERVYYVVEGIITRISGTAYSTSLRAVPGERDAFNTGAYWRIYDGDVEVATFGENALLQPTFSPDGGAVVYPRSRRDGVHSPSLLYYNGQITEIPYSAGEPYWGQTILDIVPNDGTLDAGCNLPERILIPDEVATVLPGTPNNVRASPDTESEVIGNIAAGELFTPLASFCDGNIRWWYVSYGDGVSGWTAERVGDDIFVGLATSFTPMIRNADWMPVELDFDGVMMVLVPAGCFEMGSTDHDDNEQPVHQQCFDEPYWIDKYEVTNEQYGSSSTDCSHWSSGPNQPRNCVDWFEANEYCAARNARLPTEAEWEYAARGPDSLIYPWGDVYDATVVINAYDSTYGQNQTAPVGSRPDGASWVRAMDMSGNVWEWTSSLYNEYPYGVDHESNSDTHNMRVWRGGSFFNKSSLLRSSTRIGDPSNYKASDIGFRCSV